VVKRLPGPPTAAPSEMKSAAAPRVQGLATGRYLCGLGINADLAPVLDVPTGPSAFIFSRAFLDLAFRRCDTRSLVRARRGRRRRRRDR